MECLHFINGDLCNMQCIDNLQCAFSPFNIDRNQVSLIDPIYAGRYALECIAYAIRQ